MLSLLPPKNYKLTIIHWEVKYRLLTTLLRINCNCKNFQLLVGEETIQLLRVDGLRRVIIIACAVHLARSSCCADVSMVICMGRIRSR